MQNLVKIQALLGQAGGKDLFNAAFRRADGLLRIVGGLRTEFHKNLNSAGVRGLLNPD